MCVLQLTALHRRLQEPQVEGPLHRGHPQVLLHAAEGGHPEARVRHGRRDVPERCVNARTINIMLGRNIGCVWCIFDGTKLLLLFVQCSRPLHAAVCVSQQTEGIAKLEFGMDGETPTRRV